MTPSMSRNSTGSALMMRPVQSIFFETGAVSVCINVSSRYLSTENQQRGDQPQIFTDSHRWNQIELWKRLSVFVPKLFKSVLGLICANRCKSVANFLSTHRQLRGWLAVNHPGYVKSIDAHAETRGPEGLLKGHLHCAIFCQCVKDAFCISRFLERDRHRETLWLVIAPRRCIRSH